MLVCIMAAWAIFVSWSPWFAWYIAWLNAHQMPAPSSPQPNAVLREAHILASFCGIGGWLPMLVLGAIIVEVAQDRQSLGKSPSLLRWTLILIVLCVASYFGSLALLDSTRWPVRAWWSSP